MVSKSTWKGKEECFDLNCLALFDYWVFLQLQNKLDDRQLSSFEEVRDGTEEGERW